MNFRKYCMVRKIKSEIEPYAERNREVPFIVGPGVGYGVLMLEMVLHCRLKEQIYFP